jgi:hypothetical protein
LNEETISHYRITNDSLLCLLSLSTLRVDVDSVMRQGTRWESDSPKMRSIRGSMLERDF